MSRKRSYPDWFQCPACGYETALHAGRECYMCGYTGDWIQPGETSTYQETMCERDLIDDIMDFESGAMEPDKVIPFFQRLIDTGVAWQLQGSYGRAARALIDSGKCVQSHDNKAGGVSHVRNLR